MSSEYWVEPCPPSQRRVKGPEEGTGKGVKDRELVCGDNQGDNQGDTEESGGGDPESPVHSGSQEVTREGGAGQIQVKEEEETERCPAERRQRSAQRSEERGTEIPDGGPGVCLVERYLSDCSNRTSSAMGAVELSFPDRRKEQRVVEPRGPGPFYFFGGANGAAIVTNYCESRGWRRIYNKNREDFKLKWCETKSAANYYSFREGEQLLYQIPNNKVLTTKIGLLCSLREYDRVSSKVNHGRGLRRLKMEEFFPATFRMDVKGEREVFFAQQDGVSNKVSHMWICKPTGLNQGRGIFLLKSQEDMASLRLKLQALEDGQSYRRMHLRQPQARIVQRYVQNPLLLEGRKFDVRSYLLIACTAPYMVFFRHGYVRLTCDLYDPDSSNLTAHLTNQYMQKKNPLYGLLKEDTVWSMDRFNTYVNDKCSVAKGLPRDWVMGAFAKRMKQIMTQCFFAVKSKLDRRLGFFDLIGCDFMIDEDFKVWLLEMNCNPALHTNCKILKEVVPSTVVETLDIALEIFDKCRCGQQILPLDSQREFVLLYNGESPPVPVLPGRRSRAGRTGSKSAYHVNDTKKTTKAEPVMATRRKLGRGSKNVSTTTSEMSVNVLETSGIEDGSNSFNPNATSTSPLSQSSQINEDLSMPARPKSNTVPAVPPKQHPTLKAEAPKHIPRPTKPARPRVELKLSKCTYQGVRYQDHPRHLEDLRRKNKVMSHSTPALTSVPILLMNKTDPGSDQSQSSCDPLQPTQLGRSPSGVGRPVWTEKQENRDELGELREDTQSSVNKEKEELEL